MRNTSCKQNLHSSQTDLFSSGNAGAEGVWSVELGGRRVSYSLRRSPRTRKVWLKVDPEGRLEVVVPARMPLSGLDCIIRGKTGWILEKMRSASSEKEHYRPPRFEQGAMLPFLGGLYRLEVVSAGLVRPAVRLVGDRIIAYVTEPHRPHSIREALIGWYKAQAARHISERVARLSGGLKIGRITIRDQKTRWGSCSHTGGLSFNWRIIMSPPEVVDYLVIHEVIHIGIPNHSSKFWKKVEERCPDYREHEAWLKNSGRALFGV